MAATVTGDDDEAAIHRGRDRLAPFEPRLGALRGFGSLLGLAGVGRVAGLGTLLGRLLVAADARALALEARADVAAAVAVERASATAVFALLLKGAGAGRVRQGGAGEVGGGRDATRQVGQVVVEVIVRAGDGIAHGVVLRC